MYFFIQISPILTQIPKYLAIVKRKTLPFNEKYPEKNSLSSTEKKALTKP